LQVFRSAPSNIDVGGANECLQNWKKVMN
jgi:hypothetical protein